MTIVANRYDGKVAVITGAASGIGQATALRIVAEGGQVLALDVNADGLDETAARAEGKLATMVADLRDPDTCRAAIDNAIEQFGRLDVLGNVAGIARSEYVTDVSVDAYRQMMAINVDACFFMAQAAIPHLLETKGVIINIASNAGLMGQAYSVVYCMSKGAVIQLTKALAMEYMKKPLRVLAIAPAGTDTGLVRGYKIPEGVDWDLIGHYTSPRGFAKPEDIAALFCFAASDEAHNIHGVVLCSDNGITAG
jgi:NAD(P)-dependent dehydrogenase (short-subunit alcohol dehydrogenase family)